MDKTPKSLRLHIALFGRTNVGKSSFLNLISGQDTAITSPIPGTTTDAVEKNMELLPIGPVVFIDTAGFEDSTALGDERVKRSLKVFERADVALVLCEAGVCGKAEKDIFAEAIPVAGDTYTTDEVCHRKQHHTRQKLIFFAEETLPFTDHPIQAGNTDDTA